MQESNFQQNHLATQEILIQFERAKSQSENILDKLPMLFMVIDRQGRILRGNSEASETFGLDPEELLSADLVALIGKDSWIKFSELLNPLKQGDNKNIQFELPITIGSEERMHLWQVTRMDVGSPFDMIYFSVLGKDISQLRRALSDLFALNKDLEVTGTVQKLFLPKQKTVLTREIRLAASYWPAAKSGGDWWWYDLRPDGSLLVVLADVTGHGAGSAMVTAAIAGTFNALYQRHPRKYGRSQVLEIFKFVNNYLGGLPENYYWMTMTAVEISPKHKEFKLWNAGGPPLFYLDPKGRSKSFLYQSSPLGRRTVNGKPDLKVVYRTGPFQKRDRVFAFTDGSYEFNMPDGNYFGRRRLLKLYTDFKSQAADEARDSVFQKLTEYQGSNKQPADDISFVIVEKL